MSTFRMTDLVYRELVERFEEAVEDVWPEWEEGECTLLSQKPEHLEALMLSSYRLMKYIRQWLTKQKLDYQEGWKFPNLYIALEECVLWMQRSSGMLSTEAAKLEQVSRACYHWMKTSKALGRKPTRDELENRPSKPRVYCMCCKTNVSTDDANMLCGECSGEDDIKARAKKTCVSCKWRLVTIEKDTICEFCRHANTHSMDDGLSVPKGKCYQCHSPCKPGNFLCDLCAVGGNRENKPTTIYMGNERHNVGSRVMSGPFDAVNRDYPLANSDMLLPGRRGIN